MDWILVGIKKPLLILSVVIMALLLCEKGKVIMPIASNNVFLDMSFYCITSDVQGNYVFKLGENESYHTPLAVTFNTGLSFSHELQSG